MDADRFIKVMMLTTSDQDGEALSAIRTANNFLKKNNLTWENVLRSGLSAKPKEENKDGLRRQSPDFTDIFSDIFGNNDFSAFWDRARRAEPSSKYQRPEQKPHWTRNFRKDELMALIGRLIESAKCDFETMVASSLLALQTRISRTGDMTMTQEVLLRQSIDRWGTIDDRRKAGI